MAFSWASLLSLPTHTPQRWGKGEQHSQQLLLTLSKPLARTEAVNTAQPLSSPSSVRGPRDSAQSPTVPDSRLAGGGGLQQAYLLS